MGVRIQNRQLLMHLSVLSWLGVLLVIHCRKLPEFADMSLRYEVSAGSNSTKQHMHISGANEASNC